MLGNAFPNISPSLTAPFRKIRFLTLHTRKRVSSNLQAEGQIKQILDVLFLVCLTVLNIYTLTPIINMFVSFHAICFIITELPFLLSRKRQEICCSLRILLSALLIIGTRFFLQDCGVQLNWPFCRSLCFLLLAIVLYSNLGKWYFLCLWSVWHCVKVSPHTSQG